MIDLSKNENGDTVVKNWGGVILGTSISNAVGGLNIGKSKVSNLLKSSMSSYSGEYFGDIDSRLKSIDDLNIYKEKFNDKFNNEKNR